MWLYVVQSYFCLRRYSRRLAEFLCKTSRCSPKQRSGASVHVFTPTLFVGLSIGMPGRIWGFWPPCSDEIAILLGLVGMATLLAATTHAPIMSTLMICEMTGESISYPRSADCLRSRVSARERYAMMSILPPARCRALTNEYTASAHAARRAAGTVIANQRRWQFFPSTSILQHNAPCRD